MNKLSVLVVIAIVLSISLVTASSINTPVLSAGPKQSKNYGQCKQDFNGPDKVCKKFHTGSG
jgi:hypothetical protein